MTDTPRPPQNPLRRKLALYGLLLGLLIAAGLQWHHFRNRDELIRIRFNSADHIVPGQTSLSCRSITIGRVETVTPSPANDGSFIVGARIAPKYAFILREGSTFRMNTPSHLPDSHPLAALNQLTELSFVSVIQMEPGTGAPGARLFTGLEQPAVLQLAR